MRRLVLAVCVISLSRVAAAQPAGNMQLDEFRPAMDARGYLSVDGSQVLDDHELSFGLGSLEWGRHLLAFSGGGATYSVDDVVSATLVAALGLRVGGVPLELGASLPLSIVDGAHDRLAGQGTGDLGTHLKVRLLHGRRFGLAAIAGVYLPTASPRDRFLGEPGVTPEAIAVADVDLGRVRLAVNGGVRVRPTSTFTDTMMGTMGSITRGSELPFGAAAAWALSPGRVELVGEVFGAMPLGAHHGYQPLEALGGVKVYLAKSSYLSLGAGRGLVAGGDNPDLRVLIGIVFEPRPAETHLARVEDDDVVVQAPPPAPHVDPTADRDDDGTYDIDDRCPDIPGPLYNGGCPDRDGTIITDSTIVPLRSIEFEFDSATLRATSLPVLDSVVQALVDNPDIHQVEVQGHTDERGDDAYNLDLSERRAATVRAYLVSHGIDAKRLISHGYGETRPIDPAHTEAAWARNRRVEFVIQDRSR